MTITELQQQKRWVCWRLETAPGRDKATKVPYQPNGYKASDVNPAHWRTYAECAAVASQFSGVGVVLGLVDGVLLAGADIDGCCDAATGKFTPEAREVVIGLDSYSEYSPSGDGAHVLFVMQSGLPGPGIKKPFPGTKAVEIYDRARYFTFTGRHLSKTPAELMPRQAEAESLYAKVSGVRAGLVVKCNDDEQFKKLMAGDTSAYGGDHSKAVFALICNLLRKYKNDPFKADEEFCKSGLYEEKWERTDAQGQHDYRGRTILKALGVSWGVPVGPTEEDMLAERLNEDLPTEYVIDPLNEPGHEGWFPFGEVSLIAGASGAGKTTWLVPILENTRQGIATFGHAIKPREYRILLHDRTPASLRRTADAIGASGEVKNRAVRLTPAQQKLKPGDALQEIVTANPGVQVWLIEGLDMWVDNANDMKEVSEMLDSLQRVATRNHIAVLGTVGSPKQRAGEHYQLHRDSVFGSIAWARKSETIVLLELHNSEDANSVRRCTVLVRAGKAEEFYFEFQANKGLCLTTKPDPVRKEQALSKIDVAVFSRFKPGDEVVYDPSFGSTSTFYRWRKTAVLDGRIVLNGPKAYVPFIKTGDTCPLCNMVTESLRG